MGRNDVPGYRVATHTVHGEVQVFLVPNESRPYGWHGRRHRAATAGWRRMQRYAAAGLAAIAMSATGVGLASATPAKPPVRPIASVQDNSAAMGAFTGELQTAMTAGGFVGTVIGAGTGCVLGGIAGLPLAVVPGFLGGCLVGGALLAAPGGVLGTLVVGGPTLLVAGTQLAQVLTAPAK